MESDLGLFRQYNCSIGLSDSGVELAEDYRLLRYWDVLLRAVVNVVHPYADQLLRIVDRCFQDKVSRIKQVLSRGSCSFNCSVRDNGDETGS